MATEKERERYRLKIVPGEVGIQREDTIRLVWKKAAIATACVGNFDCMPYKPDHLFWSYTVELHRVGIPAMTEDKNAENRLDGADLHRTGIGGIGSISLPPTAKSRHTLSDSRHLPDTTPREFVQILVVRILDVEKCTTIEDADWVTSSRQTIRLYVSDDDGLSWCALSERQDLEVAETDLNDTTLLHTVESKER